VREGNEGDEERCSDGANKAQFKPKHQRDNEIVVTFEQWQKRHK